MIKIILLALMLTGCHTSGQTKMAETGVDKEAVCVYYPMENRTVQAVKDKCPPNADACIIDWTEIVSPEPEYQEDNYRFRLLGHEFYHAVRGPWHGS